MRQLGRTALLFTLCIVVAWWLPAVPVSHADSSSLRALYNDGDEFEKLSGAAQTLLELKFGKKPLQRALPTPETSSRPESATLEGLADGAEAEVKVNNPAADAGAQDTQSETTLVLAGSNVVVGFNDSGSCLPACGTTANKFTGFSLSTNAGATFTDMGTLPTSANGDAGDPVLARDNTSGTIYFATLMFSGSGMQCFRSTNNGVTFGAPVNCAPGTSGFQDKEWIAVDNVSGSGQGNVYLVWRDFGAGNGIKFSRSTDGGANWGPSGGVLLKGGGAFNVQGAYVTVGPDHAVYVFWLDQSAGSGTNNLVKMRKSIDQGLTFAAERNVATLDTTGTNGGLGLGGGFRTNSFPQAAVCPTNASRLYAVFNDKASASDKADIFLVRSTDGGTNWSVPQRVNDDATTHDQWQPALAITPDCSRLFVGFYDRRNDAANSLIKAFGAIGSIDLPTGAVTFAPNFTISTASFPVVIGQDPVINSVYMGDYDTAVADNSFFYYTWGDNRDPNPNVPSHTHQPDVRFAKIPVQALSVAHLFIGLKNSDDQGTQFDLQVELLQNGTPVAHGLKRCITGVTRNPALAKEGLVTWDPFSPVSFSSGDVLALRVSTRIGTNSNGSKCSGPGGSHNSAGGLRLYYDSVSRQSRFDATFPPDASKDLNLHSDGSACPSGNGDSTGVTTRFLDTTAPTAANAKCKNSGSVNFAGGNPFAVIGVWSLAPLP